MGTCLSKKSISSSSPSSAAALAAPPPEPELEDQKKIPPAQATAVAESVKKEIFVIKQRKSHERRPEERVSNAKAEEPPSDPAATNIATSAPLTTTVTLRTSSCTKEEVDAILIQCGRLSKSSSSKEGGDGRKYSGSKRSYDFDVENDSSADNKKTGGDEDRHYSRPSHRRTPSRERDVEYKRSSSRDRSSSSSRDQDDRRRGSGSRRVSRSPGRRSETPSATHVVASSAPISEKSRPAKMVSVPASVSNRDKIINGGADSAATVVKRVSAKRNGDTGFRGAASPRSQSPACARANNENAAQHTQQQPSLSRNSSRKVEQSPYRRNPLTEIDENCLRKEQLASKSQDQIESKRATGINKMLKRKEGDEIKNFALQNQKQPDERNNRGDAAREQQQQAMVERTAEAKGFPLTKTSDTAVPTAAESLKPQAITRSRSSRRSRDLDLNLGFSPDTLLNPTSYASLLLVDIQNFHQQKNTTAAFSLPACVTKACSILEAVADLTSCTSEERSSETADWSNNKNASSNSHPDHLGQKNVEVVKDPFVESVVLVNNDDLNEPSLHKYVTVRRGVTTGGEVEQQESSGSNSFVGGHQWASSSWEPNSADSTCTTSRLNCTGESMAADEEMNLSDSENQAAVSTVAHDSEVDARRRLRSSGRSTDQLPSTTLSAKKRELHHQRHHV